MMVRIRNPIQFQLFTESLLQDICDGEYQKDFSISLSRFLSETTNKEEFTNIVVNLTHSEFKERLELLHDFYWSEEFTNQRKQLCY